MANLYIRSTAEKAAGANAEDLYLRTAEEKEYSGLESSIVAVSQTSVPDLFIQRPLESTITAASQTSTVILVRRRKLSAAITAASQTSTVILVTPRPLTATITAASQTPTITLFIARPQSATIIATSQTSTFVLDRKIPLESAITAVCQTSTVAWSVEYLGLILDGNEIAGNVAGYDNIGYWDTETFGPNTQVYATITTKPAVDEYIELLMRFDPVLGNGYAMRFTTLSGTDKIEIRKYDTWISEQLGDDIELELAPGDALGFEIIKQVMQVYHKAVGNPWFALGEEISH